MQSISLVLPDLFQDRLAKLAEGAAQADMISSPVAQHGPRGRFRPTVVAEASRACS